MYLWIEYIRLLIKLLKIWRIIGRNRMYMLEVLIKNRMKLLRYLNQKLKVL
jgi:hypothetical protein